MIRTRDFLLFVIIVVFLLLGIGTTLVYEKFQQVTGAVTKVDFNNQISELEVETIQNGDDRAANLARLKEKISEGSVISVPDIDTVIVQETKEPETSITNRTVNYCENLTDHTNLKSSWPAKVVVSEVEGARMVYEQIMVIASSASSTTQSIEEVPLLQLSLNQVREAKDNCLPSDVIGITTTGGLLTNNDVSRYSIASELTLIGYALDGLPIYGVRTDASHLDSCGGESGSLGYRYYLRSGENFVLGCFAGTPATFLR